MTPTVARLVSWVERELSTDFAMLTAQQERVADRPDTLVFATSSPGCVAMFGGHKYATVQVRLERWDARPDAPEEDWEDVDELPWQTIEGEGPVVVSGFDPPEPGGLVVDGLGRGRVQVLAAGRHRYAYGDSVDLATLGPERWLLRFWPDEAGLDAMAGARRRLACDPLLPVRRSGWEAAMHAWRTSGWSSLLSVLTAFDEIERSVARVGRPCRPDELVPLWGPHGIARDRGGPYTWESPVIGHGWALPREIVAERSAWIFPLVSQVGELSAESTFHDLLTWLREVGLLASCEGLEDGSLVPNPAPRPVWEVLDLPDRHDVGVRLQSLAVDFQTLEPDIVHLLDWAPGGVLATTPRTIALRLALIPEDVIGTLRLLSLRGQVNVVPDLEVVTPDTPVVIGRGAGLSVG